MNNIYRLVWSHVANSFVAVAENSRTGKKGSRAGRGGRKLFVAALLIGGNYAATADAVDVTWNAAYPNYILLPPYDAVKDTGYAFTIDSLVQTNHYSPGTVLNILGPIPTISTGTNGTSTGVTVLNALPGGTGTDPDRIITIVSTDSNGTPTTITSANIGQYTYSPSPAVPQENLELNVTVPGLDGSYQVITVYDSSSFISAADTPVSDMVLPVYDPNSIRIFNDFGIASVASTGGQANINVGSSDPNAPIAAAANTIDLLTKNSVLAKADGSGSALSSTEWRSDNYIHFRPAIELSTDTQNLEAQSAKYDFSITLPNYEQVGNKVVRLLDKTFVINSSNDIAGVNDFLIGANAYAGKPQIQYWLTAGATVNGEVIDSSVEAQNTYDAIINGMLAKEENTSINLTYHVWDDKGVHTNNATLATGDLNVIYATGANASGLVTNNGSLAVDGASAVMRADNGAIITNDGAINAWRSSGNSPESVGMVTTDATAVNNGTLNAGLFIEKDGTNQNVSNAGSKGMQGFGSSTLTNNGHINAAITDTTTNNAVGMRASGTTTATNAATGTIALVGNANNLGGKAGGYGVWLDQNATFTNAGHIYLGVTPVLSAAAPTPVPMTGGDLSAGIRTQSAGDVNNTGTITLEENTRNAAGISIEGATGDVTNSGTINVLGKLTNGSAAANYGLNVVDNIGAVTHRGTINVDGDNNIAINVLAQKAGAAVTTTGGSAITVGKAGDTGGSDGQPYTYRNYAVYAEGLNTQHAQVDLNSTIVLLSAGAIGVHARGDAQIDINPASTLSFENIKQMGYYAWGNKAKINIGNAIINDNSQADSILFAVDHGAVFAGGIGAAASYQLTVSGDNATGIIANGVDETTGTKTSLTTGSAKIFVNGENAVGVKVTGGAVGNISDGGIVLQHNNTTAVLIDGRNYNIDGSIDTDELQTIVTSNASVTSSAGQSGIVGYNVSHAGELNLSGSGISLNGTNSTGIVLHDNGKATVAAPVTVSGTNNIGVDIQNNGALTNNNLISVSGAVGSGNVGVRVGGANAVVNTLGNVNASGGLAAVQLIGAGANLTVNGTGNHITASGGADGVRMDAGATSFTASDTLIDISGSGAGINNNADTSNINLSNVTINASDGPAIRTAVTFSAIGTGNTLNVSGSGDGFAFMKSDGSVTTGNLTIGNGYTINGTGAGSVGILARTSNNVSSGAVINMAANAGSAIVATDGLSGTSRTITNTGIITSLGVGAPVINASGAGNTTVTNSGTLLAANATAQAILTGTGNDVVAIDRAGTATRGEITLGSGTDQFSWTAGDYTGGVTFTGADGNDRATFGSVSLAKVTHVLSEGGTNNTLTLNSTNEGTNPALLGSFSADNLAKGTNIGTGWSTLTLDGDPTDARVVDDLTLSGVQTININNGATLRSGDSATLAGQATIHNYNVNTSGATSLLSFDGASDQTYAGVISGDGGMERINSGNTILLGDNTYTGNTLIGSGSELTLGNGNTTGSLSEQTNITDNGILTVNHSDAVTLNGVISGSGAFRQIGTGVTRLGGNNSYAGTTSVEQGTLLVNGVQSGAGQTTVMNGSTLGGYGTIGGNVLFQRGTVLRPGDDSRGNGTGTLTINGDLVLAGNTDSQFQLGQAYTPGGALNDLVEVKGNLTLDGVLNVALTAGGTFLPGVYRLFNYGGALANNIMNIGTLPPNDGLDYVIQTNISHEVNLILNFVDPSQTLQFWDGDLNDTPNNHGSDGIIGNNTIDGGFGHWTRQASGTSNNWTQPGAGIGNAPWSQDAFAVFQGRGAEVLVDDQFGIVVTSGMQFDSNGYILNADPLNPDSQLHFIATNPPSQLTPDNNYEAQGATHADSYFAIRVGAGAAGADVTTIINADLVQDNLADGNIRLLKTDPGRLILTGNNLITGGVEVWNGTLNINNDNALGATTNSVLLKNGATFQAGADLTTPRLFFVGGSGGGALDVYGHTFTPTGVIGGEGPLTIKDSSLLSNNGVLDLGVENTYLGDTSIIGKNGTGQLTVNANTTGAFGTPDSQVSLTNQALLNFNNAASAQTHTFAVDNATLAFNNSAGAGQSTINLVNGGTAIFTDNSQGDNANVALDASSTLELSSNADAGSATVSNSGKVLFADNAQGAGAVISNLAGGLVDISAALAGTSVGSLSGAGNVALGAATLIEGALGRNDTISGIIDGSGNLVKTGTGTLNLTAANTWTGATTAQQGVLLINGNQVAATGETTVNNGATLGGAGVLGGSVVVDDGGHLAAGQDLASVGVLTMGALTLNQNSQVDFQFGQPYTVGGALNDLININGDLNLNGKLNITQTAGGSFDVGVYRVFNYSGALTDNILDIGSAPPAADDLYVQTSIAGQVNLVNRTGYVMRFWDGFGGNGGALKNNGEIDGGNGIWQSGSGNDNWTTDVTSPDGRFNTPFSNGSFAVFGGTAGNVTIDTSLGEVAISGAQFATDGYVIGGDNLTTHTANTIIRVGDGTAPSAGYTATINSVIDGEGGINKADLGTLILNGNNQYQGGTQVSGGVLQVSSDNNLGAAGTSIGLSGGTLRYGAAFDTARQVTLSGVGGAIDTNGNSVSLLSAVTGNGDFTKLGKGTLTLTQDSRFAGLTTISDGVLQLGNGGTAGNVGGNIVDNATLAINRADSITLNGDISGSGQVWQQGSGTTILNGSNTWSGITLVENGTLLAAGENRFSQQSSHIVSSGATLDTGGYSQSVANLVNQGTINLRGGDVGSTLTVNGDYVGLNGTLKIAAQQHSPGVADRLVINGGAATGNTLLDIDVSQLGEPTTGDGIMVVEAQNGATTTAQTTKDAFTIGSGILTAGAWEYQLFAGNEQGAGEDWFLRAGYRPDVPGFDTLAAIIRQADLAVLGTLHQRVGDEQPWKADVPEDQEGRFWARYIVKSVDQKHDDPTHSQSSTNYNGMQMGLDLYQNDKWRAGLYTTFMDIDSSINGITGMSGGAAYNSTFSSYLGAYGTWTDTNGFYVDNVLQYGYHSVDLKNMSDRKTYNPDGNSVVASVEVGKPWQLGDSNWQLEPQAQLIYQYSDFDDVTLSDRAKTNVSVDADGSVIGRLGVRLAANYDTDYGKVKPYVRVNYWQELSDGQDTVTYRNTANRAGATEINANQRFQTTEAAIGTTWAVTADVQGYTEIGKTWDGGGDTSVSSDVSASVGMKIRF